MVGFINVNKPEGINSSWAVSKLKKLFNCPCGHMGTLDPMAEGVLPIGIGKTSRLFPYLLNKKKEYIAQFTFGYLTDTLDKTGTTIKETKVIPTESEIKAKLNDFIGKIDQIPPKYSAKCINGKRGYELARKGVDFTLKPKQVEVYSFTLNKRVDERTFEFIIECGGGTYIRSLARDLGESLNSLATMTRLVRSKCGVFSLDNAVSYENLTNYDKVMEKLIKADSVLDYPEIHLSSKQAQKIIDGVFDNLGFDDGLYKVYREEEFLGIGESKEGILKINSYVW